MSKFKPSLKHCNPLPRRCPLAWRAGPGEPRRNQIMESLTFIRLLEDRIRQRLGRNVLLDDLSATELEQLDYASKWHTDKQLEKALNQILHLDN